MGHVRDLVKLLFEGGVRSELDYRQAEAEYYRVDVVLRGLEPGSTFLQGLYDPPLPDDLHFYLLFSYSGESAMVRGSDDGTVTIPSMLDYRAQDQSRKTYGFAESHTSILESEKAIATVMEIIDDEAERARAIGKK